MSHSPASNTVVINFPGSDAYTAFEYPAGESQVRLSKDYLEPIRIADEIIIVAKVASALDLVHLILLSDAIYGLCLKKQTLRLLYLPYARADRRFVHGDCAGLQVFGKMLDAGHFSKVVTLDVHSSRAHDYVENLNDNAPTAYILKAIDYIQNNIVRYVDGGRRMNGYPDGGTILLPDEGSVARYSHHAFPWPIMHCSKKRDPETGKLLKFIVPEDWEFRHGPILIVDDICDGGGTFLGIAEKLDRQRPRFLYVTHGIFSKGFLELGRNFSGIFTTDTVTTPEDVEDSGGLVKILDVRS
jgi:ribose-phosphate pyrophosphokinase